jgi:putative hydrolase of the HAD superfamily
VLPDALQAVLFDLDGTLVDHESAAAGAVVEWAAEYGITGSGVAGRWAKISDRHYQAHQRRELTFPEQRRRRVNEFLGLSVDADEADEIFKGYMTRYEARWVLFDDAVPALRRVRAAGMTAAVLTNGNEDHQRYKLERVGITDEIDVLITADKLPAGKPHPQIFLHAVDRLGVSVADVVMVGDSLERDVRGALAVGIEAVLLDRYDVHPDAAVRRIRSLQDLPATLSR